jgi:acetyl esterase/lipase
MEAQSSTSSRRLIRASKQVLGAKQLPISLATSTRRRPAALAPCSLPALLLLPLVLPLLMQPRNRLDIFLPRKEWRQRGPRRTVIFVTGGAWTIGYKGE